MLFFVSLVLLSRIGFLTRVRWRLPVRCRVRRGFPVLPASTAALLSLLEPLTATLLSVLFLGNRLGPAGIAGAALLATAVALSVMGAADSARRVPL